MAVSADYQFEFQSVTMGPGTSYGIQSISGLDMPDLRTADVERPGQHGMFLTRGDLYGGREVQLDMVITAATAGGLQTLLDNLANATEPASASSPLQFQLPSFGIRRVNAYPRRRSITYTFDQYQFGIARARIAFWCPDPRIYADTQESVTGIGSGGSTVTNSGNIGIGAGSEELILTITGAYSNPSITNTTDGSKSIDLTASGLGTIVIDVGQREVTVSGTDRYDLVDATTAWWELLPGNNTISISSGTLQVQHRDAYQ